MASLASCQPHRQDQVTIDGSPSDAQPEYVPPITDVLVTASAIWWTYGTEACSLEFGCIYGVSTLSYQEVPEGGIWVTDRSPAGAMAIAGDEDGVFIVTGTSHEERYLKRVDSAALSIPRPWTQGPAIDETHVYWAEQPTLYGAFALRKASRTGNGTDAVTIASGFETFIVRLVTFGDHVWGFDRLGRLFRVPKTGGAVEDVSTDVISINVGLSGLYVGRLNSSFNAPSSEIGRLDTNAAYTKVLDVDVDKAPQFLVADDRDIFWSGAGANALESIIYRAPVAGGPAETVATQHHRGYAFGLTPDRVLFDFTPEGYQVRPR